MSWLFNRKPVFGDDSLTDLYFYYSFEYRYKSAFCGNVKHCAVFFGNLQFAGHVDILEYVQSGN